MLKPCGRHRPATLCENALLCKPHLSTCPQRYTHQIKLSPFSRLLSELRRRHGLLQKDLAELVGIEQTYLSALETGIKGPPTPDFVARLQKALNLDANAIKALEEAVDNSQRKMSLSADAPEEVFEVFNEFRRQLDTIHPSQLQLFRMALALKGDLNEGQFNEIPRIKRRSKKKIEDV